MKSRKITYFKYFSLFFTITVLVFITGCTGAPPIIPIINSVTYNGNGSTAGTVPIDQSSPYESGETVTVLGNTGDLIRINAGGTSYRFTGPAGGYIFYDKGSYYKADFTIVKAAGNGTVPINPNYDGWRYLEAAPYDQSAGTEWGCYGVSISGAGGTAVGTGKQNTIDIEAGCTIAGTAADICANLSLGGYSDWFLPSKDELNLMYENLKVFGVGSFAGTKYWSSSEGAAYNAWAQYFSNGAQYYYDKYDDLRVRAVRAF